jgi:GNAT superfamily N-acetyltransferase
MTSFVMRLAVPVDSAAIYNLVNGAYAVELGDTGLAFKKENRYLAESEVATDIAADPVTSSFFCCCVGNEIAGVIRCVLRSDDPTAVDFGPFAVTPNFQGKGIGGRLIGQAEEWTNEKAATRFLIEVVNHRTDLWDDSDSELATGFYARKGFRKVGEIPCDAEHNCDESKVTRPSNFIILERVLAGASN